MAKISCKLIIQLYYITKLNSIKFFSILIYLWHYVNFNIMNGLLNFIQSNKPYTTNLYCLQFQVRKVWRELNLVNAAFIVSLHVGRPHFAIATMIMFNTPSLITDREMIWNI